MIHCAINKQEDNSNRSILLRVHGYQIVTIYRHAFDKRPDGDSMAFSRCNFLSLSDLILPEAASRRPLSGNYTEDSGICLFRRARRQAVPLGSGYITWFLHSNSSVIQMIAVSSSRR